MHSSSLENMQKCYERYICGDYFQSNEELTVLDIGGANVNGSYADIFSPARFNYIAADIAPADGVNLVLEDPYQLPFDDGSVHIIVSGQAFEHVEFFWLLFEEMARIVRPDGWILLIAPSSGPIHRCPVDCYRFYPDAYRALARYTGLHLLNVFTDDRGPWNDLVGVFSRNIEENRGLSVEWRPLAEEEQNRYARERNPATRDIAFQSEELESKKGETSYLDVLETIHRHVAPHLYLEIGINMGFSLALAQCQAIAIDPEPDIDPAKFPGVELFRMPSDFYFENHWPPGADRQAIDLAFIDGMHLFEFALRDFMSIEARSSSSTVVLIDDVFPNHVDQATRERQTRVWTGDVWKFLVCLRDCRPDLQLTMLDTFPTGMLMITGLNKNNRALTKRYNPLVRKYGALQLEDFQTLVLDRSEAESVSDQRYLAKLASTPD